MMEEVMREVLIELPVEAIFTLHDEIHPRMDENQLILFHNHGNI
jgi:hypothetical protein